MFEHSKGYEDSDYTADITVMCRLTGMSVVLNLTLVLEFERFCLPMGLMLWERCMLDHAVDVVGAVHARPCG